MARRRPLSICECVYLRVAPSARAANSLLLLPLFRPAAPSDALSRAWSSIICVSVDRPFPANSRNRFSQTPRRAQRSKAIIDQLSEVHTRAGNRTSDGGFRTCTMPLMTRRSSARSTPRTSVGQMRCDPSPLLVAQTKTGSCAQSRSPSNNENEDSIVRAKKLMSSDPSRRIVISRLSPDGHHDIRAGGLSPRFLSRDGDHRSS